jgi:hypothetical protein
METQDPDRLIERCVALTRDASEPGGAHEDELDAAFAELFRLMAAPVPSPAWTARVLDAVGHLPAPGANLAQRRGRPGPVRVNPLSVAIGAAVLAVMVAVGGVVLATTIRIGGVLTWAVDAGVSMVVSAGSMVNLWRSIATLGYACIVAASTPEAVVALGVSVLGAALAWGALVHLLSDEREAFR